ncbi:MAG: major capsid family protein [Leptolyngbyaceae cyanobacterium]
MVAISTRPTVTDYQQTANYAMAVAAELQRHDSSNILPIVSNARLDAHSAGQLQEHLTLYSPEIIYEEYPEYKYAAGLVPIDAREYVGVERIKNTRITRVGKWGRASDASISKNPIDIGMDDVEYGNAYFDAFITFTTEELDRISFARQYQSMGAIVDTVAAKVRAVQEAYQELINRIMAFGSPRQGVYGLHTHPGVTKVRAPYKMGLTASTPDQNIAILTEMIKIISRLSGQRSYINAMLTPKSLAIELGQQQRNTASDTSTLTSFLKSPDGLNIGVEATPEMDTAGPGKTTAIHAYRLDVSRLKGCIPKRMRQVTDPVYTNGVWRTDFDCSISGVHIVRPYDHVMIYDLYDLD